MNKTENPPPPKRPVNAYFMFRNEIYNDVRAKNPELKMLDHSKIIKERYDKMDEGKLKSMKEQYEKDLKKYKDEMAVYEAKYGKIEKEGKKGKKSGASETEEESKKKKKDKGKKAETVDKKKDAKKDKKDVTEDKKSKAGKDKKAVKAEPEQKKANKKK